MKFLEEWDVSLAINSSIFGADPDRVTIGIQNF